MKGLGCTVYSLLSTVEGVGFRIEGVGFRIEGVGCRTRPTKRRVIKGDMAAPAVERSLQCVIGRG